jgi:endonuclease/exonuclease/phosphatase family metal-dependent hydrolase
MRKIVAAFTALLFSLISGAQTEVKVMSFNIRLDVKSDGENWWENRKDKVAGLMKYYGADFIGGQEVQHHQLVYLKEQLSGYDHIGVGRDDGKEKGEYSCIFYNKEKFVPVKQGTFWLSQTPDTVSMGWDAVCNRVCTWGLFRLGKTKKMIWIFNTHFDHMGKLARTESAKLILAKMKELTAGKNYPVVFMGDLNSKPADEPVSILNTELNNARTISAETPYGPADTWNGFKFNKQPEGCIDYIFTSRFEKLTVRKFATITDSYDMKYPSDHFPVMASLEF